MGLATWWQEQRRVVWPTARAVWIALLLTAASAWGSLYSDELKVCHLFWFVGAEGEWSWKAHVFWTLLVVTAASIFWHEFSERHKAEKRELAAHERESEFRKEIERVPTLLRTLPPTQFLKALGIASEKAALLMFQAGQNGYEAEEVAGCIRVILNGISSLARIFDNAPENYIYGSNVMLFSEPSGARAWHSKLRFVGDRSTFNPDGLRGLLILSRRLSSGNTEDEDETIEEFALPVPENCGEQRHADNTGGWLVLAGAPYAFAKRQFDFIPDTSGLGNWCRTEGSFNDLIARELDGYFKAHGASIRSFFSVPLYQPSLDYKPHDDRVPIGVVNVHWNFNNVLMNKDSALMFSNAVYPLIATVAILVSQSLELSGIPDPK